MSEIFDLNKAPLTGSNLIEAGAGTGKTFNIAGLYIRLLLEQDLTVDRILVVTFTIAATEELKGRIRAKISETIEAFKSGRCSDDTMEELTRRISDRESALYKLNAALRQFDEAAIFTIHGFCRRMLNDYAFESTMLFETEFLQDQSSLLAGVINDFWRKYITGKSEIFLSYMANSSNDSIDKPEKLYQILGNNYTKPFLKIIPQVEIPQIGEIEKSFITSFAKVKEAWPFNKTEVLNLLLNHESLNRSKYSKTSIPGWGDNMASALEANPPSPGMFKYFEKFASSVINSSLKSKEPVELYHEFFELCEELNNIRTRLIESYNKTILTLKVKLYDYVRAELDKKKKADNVQSFDDLLSDLYKALHSPIGKSLASSIRKRYKAALIDEFQDTDPVQYDIFKTIFSDPESILFLIGDPKQAIYAFRGADIFAYMKAIEQVDTRYGLHKNWRSQPDLIEAINAIYQDVDKPFIYEAIPFVPASSGKGDDAALLKIKDKQSPPLELWYLDSRTLGEQFIHKGYINKTSAIDLIALSVAAEISRLLTIADKNEITINGHHLVAGDFAVLVRTNNEAAKIKEYLSKYDIPSVLYSDKSVFETDEARQVWQVMMAVAEPTDAGLIRAALITDIFRYTANKIHELIGDDIGWEDILEQFRSYHQKWLEYGFISMYHLLLSEMKVRSRILSLPDGERRLTNLLHLGELIHKRSTESDSGISGLVKWLSLQLQGGGERSDEGQLRLESDENAVKIVTIHKSKGLEYSVVFCPYSWSGSRLTRFRSVLFHNPDDADRLTLDLGSDVIEQSKAKTELETLAENLRLLYVALTRAKHRCYLVWGRFNLAGTSSIAYTFHQPPLNELSAIVNETDSHFQSLSDDDILKKLDEIQKRAENAIALKAMPLEAPQQYHPLKAKTETIDYQKFTGEIDRHWRISSFTNLSYSAETRRELPDHDLIQAPVEPLISDIDIEPEGIFAFPKGARAGVFCHELFELIDFKDNDMKAIDDLIAKKLGEYGFESTWHNAIKRMILNTLNTKLKAGNSSFKLADIAPTERLNELEFYFPLKHLTADQFNGIYRDYKSPAMQNLPDISWRNLDFKPVRGFLKGFIDLVFRHKKKYYLVDWKSNHLGNAPELYSAENIARSMLSSRYILQYHLYTVALDKYLSHRLKDYDYARDFGGVFYLFIRGITEKPNDTYGIYYDKPEPDLISKLSSLLINTDSHD